MTSVRRSPNRRSNLRVVSYQLSVERVAVANVLTNCKHF